MRYVELNSGGLQISISSWMNNLSIYSERVLVLTLMSCSIMILLERGYILYNGSYCGSLRDAWRTTGSSGSDNRACLSSNVYGMS